MSDRLADYDYELPAELIAREPPPHREDARLMVISRQDQSIRHHSIRELPDLLRRNDRLVLNNTRVLPARLLGYRSSTGGRWEGLFLRELHTGQIQLLGQARGRLMPGETISLEPNSSNRELSPLALTLVDKQDDGSWFARPETTVSPFDWLSAYGRVPLPPYMQREEATAVDEERYQTVYAQNPGSVAAPTAGLHFTPELLARCEQAGITRSTVSLHVGVGTFRPVATELLSQHVMHEEWCELTSDVVQEVRQTQQTGGRIVAVGTTACRTLESAARQGQLAAYQGATDLFIRPPYLFRVVELLLTNFHLPKSTLFVLVCTLAGRDLMQRAYAEAIAERYRFYSYGDAMLITP